MPDDRRKLAAPCGLNCGSCGELLLDKTCHGRGCAAASARQGLSALPVPSIAALLRGYLRTAPS
jgi:hypothetical protein